MSARDGVAVVLGVVIVPAVVAVACSQLAVSGGWGWQIAEGVIVFAVVVLADLLALWKFGGYVRRRAFAERLAARNARIRGPLPYEEPNPL